MAIKIHSLQIDVGPVDYLTATHIEDSSAVEGFIDLLDENDDVVALVSRHNVSRIDINN